MAPRKKPAQTYAGMGAEDAFEACARKSIEAYATAVLVANDDNPLLAGLAPHYMAIAKAWQEHAERVRAYVRSD